MANQNIIDEAIAAGAVRADLTATEFQMGIALITRPLPNVALPNLTKHQEWLVGVFLDGLRPREV